MRLSDLLLNVFRFLIPPALIGTLYLYVYPIVHGCEFPEAKLAEAACLVERRAYVPPVVAPFRLLALGDPQLEGDTSLPDQNAAVFPSLLELGKRVKHGDFGAAVSGLSTTTRDLFAQDVPRLLQGYRKRLDLWGNDLYLAHIYRSVSWWTQPTHTVVLGDLLGSQWVSEEEFGRRSDRFWKRVFKGAERVPRRVTDVSGYSEVLGQDKTWRNRVIAVAGNHDIGYAGDINEHRIKRFEETYGSVNWEIRFKLDNATSQPTSSVSRTMDMLVSSQPELRVIILNSMNLDEPALKPELQQQSRDFVDNVLYHTDNATPGLGTILLTHIPFHKESGICIDAPFFDYFPWHQGGGIKEQNHLSKDTSVRILNGLVGYDKQGQAVVINGHDHEGCDTYHYRAPESADPDPTIPAESSNVIQSSQWDARRYQLAQSQVVEKDLPGVREITVRSMMGSFSGNAGLLSAWFDLEVQEWKFEYDICLLGTQHIWWAIHVLDLVVLSLGVTGLVALLWEETAAGRWHDKVKLKDA